MSIFTPDRYFSRISFISVKFDIQMCGFKGVLLDVDNTVLTRDTRNVPADVAAWLEKAKEAGILLCFLSNNFHDDVQEMAQQLSIPIVSKALKPLPFGYLRACSRLGVSPKQALMIGDQLSTDIAGAHLVGMQAYMVCPLVQNELKHTQVLRAFESAFLKDAEPEGAATFTHNLSTDERCR